MTEHFPARWKVRGERWLVVVDPSGRSGNEGCRGAFGSVCVLERSDQWTMMVAMSLQSLEPCGPMALILK